MSIWCNFRILYFILMILIVILSIFTIYYLYIDYKKRKLDTPFLKFRFYANMLAALCRIILIVLLIWNEFDGSLLPFLTRK